MILYNLIQEHFCEYNFILKIIEIIENLQFNLIVTSNPYDIPYVDNNQKTIVILTSDEYARVPCYRDKVFKIFRMFNKEEILVDNILPIPLGFCSYSQNIDNNFCKKDIDVVFLGQDTGDRRVMFDAIEKSKHNIYFNCSGRHNFRGGLSKENYISIMKRSKISLVPDGHPNFETSRFSESFMFGCNVITTSKPNFWYYDNNYFECVKPDWSNLDETIEICLKKENYKINIDYYNKHLSPEAVAEYIVKNIC